MSKIHTDHSGALWRPETAESSNVLQTWRSAALDRGLFLYKISLESSSPLRAEGGIFVSLFT